MNRLFLDRPLGQDAWDKSKWYYDQLSLKHNGDVTEQYAADHFRLDEKMPSYERFWKYYVAPASRRPDAVFLRDEADEIMSFISQRSYSAFSNIVDSLEQLEIIEKEGLGWRNRNATLTLTLAGNALVMFSELERLIAGPTNQYTKDIGFLADRLGTPIKPLSKSDKSTWLELRENIVVYRHYLTHNGLFLTVNSKASGVVSVLRREHIEGMEPLSWRKAEERHLNSKGDWQELGEACTQAVGDTIALMGLGYEALANQMENLLSNADYQRLWGWRDRMAEIPNPPPETVEGSSATRGSDVLWDVAPSADVAAAAQPLPASFQLPIPASGVRNTD